MKAIKGLLWVVGVLVALAAVGALTFWARPVSCFNELMYVRLSLAGVESHAVQVGGHRVHYYAEGPSRGPVVVLVHGLGGRADDWRELAPYFAKAGFRVYLPDLPGYGRSEQPPDFSYSVSDEAGAVVGRWTWAAGRWADGLCSAWLLNIRNGCGASCSSTRPAFTRNRPGTRGSSRLPRPPRSTNWMRC